MSHRLNHFWSPPAIPDNMPLRSAIRTQIDDKLATADRMDDLKNLAGDDDMRQVIKDAIFLAENNL
jgi:hypothetical protein